MPDPVRSVAPAASPSSAGSTRAGDASTPAELAFDLRSAVGVLVRRFRQDRALSAPQMAAISWLARKGPQTTSALAALERMRPQSMAATVAQLEQAGLAVRRPDEHDGRKLLIELTDAGRVAHQQYLDTGESWLAESIDEHLSADEQAELARALALIGRLVDES